MGSVLGFPGVDPSDAAVGARLKRWREQRGMSVDDLARLLGISPEEERRAEAGRAHLDSVRLGLATSVLHLPIWALVSDSRAYQVGARGALVGRSVFAFVGWGALGLQYGLMLGNNPDKGVAELTLNYLSFFTILTNVLVAAALSLTVVGAGTRLGRWAGSEGVRAGVTMYVVVVGLVYHFLLHTTWNPQGWSLVANILLHYVMPTAMLLDWLLFTPRGRLRWMDPVKWLAFPLVYGGWTLIHGYAADWWPYWFTDVSKLGLGVAAFYFGGLLVFFLVTGLILVAIDRRLGRRDRTAASA